MGLKIRYIRPSPPWIRGPPAIFPPVGEQLNLDLQGPQERERFRNLVGILLSCGLTFAPTSVGTGGGARAGGEHSFGRFQGAIAQEFVLEPAIDQVTDYYDYHLTLSYHHHSGRCERLLFPFLFHLQVTINLNIGTINLFYERQRLVVLTMASALT